MYVLRCIVFKPYSAMIIVNAFGNECMNTEVHVCAELQSGTCLLHMTIATRPSPCFHQQVKRSNQPKKKKQINKVRTQNSKADRIIQKRNN